MKRAAEELPTPEKRAKNHIKVVEDPSGSACVRAKNHTKVVEDPSGSACAERALAYLLLSYAPGLAAPAPRQAWGLDR
eukprot:CAMPEP_0117497128 /NCGR_PEP_ID=MMETSP0784-20121206/21017_1 /TAXON_ID=39447 /ORGANISM="" /LENGTH=77 /DNA_ID=CAMNT_0005292129 /DNA_START=109 /DNA_END=338 /DNA_ORIENTATION=-